MDDETDSQGAPVPNPDDRVGLGDVAATVVEAVAKPIARMLRRAPGCADCARRKARIRAAGNKLGTIRIGRRPK